MSDTPRIESGPLEDDGGAIAGERHQSGKKSWSCPADPHGCMNKIQCERQGWCEVAGSVERIEFVACNKHTGEKA